jgi:hypothetical protein
MSAKESSAPAIPALTTQLPSTPVIPDSSVQSECSQAADGQSQTAETSEIPFASASADLMQTCAAVQTLSSAAAEEVTPTHPAAPAATVDKTAPTATPMDSQATPSTSNTSSATDAQQAAAAPTALPQAMGECFRLQIAPPMSQSDPAQTGSAMPANKPATPKNAADAAGSKSSTAATTAEPTKAKAADTLNAASDASSNNSQTNGGATQHDTSQTAVVVAKTVDITSAQTQPVPVHASVPGSMNNAGTPSHVVGGLVPGADRTEAPPSPLDGDEAGPTSGINAARLIQTIGETEMRVGMHTAEFGNVSIRTSVSQQQMLAQISVDHGGLGEAIAAHIPTMQAKLGDDYGLHTLINVDHHGAGTSSGQGNSQQQEQRGFTPSSRFNGAAMPVERDVGTPVAASQLAVVNAGRLDIRA